MTTDTADTTIRTISYSPSLRPTEVSGETERDDPTNEGAEGSLVLRMADCWPEKVDLVRANGIIISLNAEARVVEWPREYASPPTGTDAAPVFRAPDEATRQYVVRNGLTEGVMWLRESAPCFFDGAEFEIEVLRADDEADSQIALRVFAAFSPSEFRELRRRLCKEMLLVGHGALYEAISIFQRRSGPRGRQGFSWHSSFSVG